MIPLIVGILLFILFIVTIVFAASTWRGWHIAVVCLTFLAVVGLVVIASLSHKTHMHWKSEHANAEKMLLDAKEQGHTLKYGDSLLAKSPDSLLETQGRLNRALLDRGRVWRQCTPGVPSGNTIPISTVPPSPTGEPGDPATAKPNGIEANMVLYAFREDVGVVNDEAGNPIPVPIAYLGEFRVAEAQPTGVTLEPTMPLDGIQQRLVSDPSARWSLHEMMPVDSHYVFSVPDPDEGAASTSGEEMAAKPLDDTNTPVFGGMNDQALRQIFSITTGLPVDNEVITEMIADYAKDGSPASQQDVNTRPLNIWQKLEFEKAHKERVDSNNLDSGMSGNYFDAEGYAEASVLRRSQGDGDDEGKEASFRENDIGIFPYSHDIDKQLVDQLVSSGTCRSLGPVFVRNLRDYEGALHNIRERIVKRNEDIRRAQRDIESLQQAILSVQKQTSYRQDERTKLQEDQVGYKRDDEKLTELLAALESQKTTINGELSQLWESNLALAQQYEVFSAQLSEEINRRAENIAAQIQ
jgi:hypothetical protein